MVTSLSEVVTMAGRGRQGVDYMKPKEPSFLTKFKREIGYKEGPTVNSKVTPVTVTLYSYASPRTGEINLCAPTQAYS